MWNIYAGKKNFVMPLSLTAEWEEPNLLFVTHLFYVFLSVNINTEENI